MSHTYDPYTNVIDTMTKAMELGHIDQSMFEILKNPQREIKVYLPVEMDDGPGLRGIPGTALQYPRPL